MTVGRKGRDADAPRARPDRGARSSAMATGRPSPMSCRSPGSSPTTTWRKRTIGSIFIYPAFVSTLVQRVRMDTLLPIRPGEDTAGVPGNQFIFEPSPRVVLEQILPRYVATRVYQAVLEATASEQSSRMVAMKSATENAEELIDDLTLSYNKVRQANITREMIEIASGARAT